MNILTDNDEMIIMLKSPILERNGARCNHFCLCGTSNSEVCLESFSQSELKKKSVRKRYYLTFTQNSKCQIISVFVIISFLVG